MVSFRFERNRVAGCDEFASRPSGARNWETANCGSTLIADRSVPFLKLLNPDISPKILSTNFKYTPLENDDRHSNIFILCIYIPKVKEVTKCLNAIYGASRLYSPAKVYKTTKLNKKFKKGKPLTIEHAPSRENISLIQ